MNRLRPVCWATLLPLAMLIMLLAAGCQDKDFVDATYKSLSISNTTYDAVMRASVEACDKGVITEVQRQNIFAYGEKFKASWETAKSALVDYAKLKASDPDADQKRAAVTRALQVVTNHLDDLVALAQTLELIGEVDHG